MEVGKLSSQNKAAARALVPLYGCLPRAPCCARGCGEARVALGVFPALQGLTIDFGNTKVTMQSNYLIIKH